MSKPIATGPAPGSDASTKTASSGAKDRTVSGSLRVAAVFSDHMVMQRNRPIPVFGTAPAGSVIHVELQSTNGGSQTETLRAASIVTASEHWLVELPAVPAGGTYTLLVSRETPRDATHEPPCETLTFVDVVVGEVWLAGGQSNMELELRNSGHADTAVAASADPLLRFYNTPKTGVVDPATEAQSGWVTSSPETSGYMSAVAYHFARKLRAELGPDMPVGIIDCYIGGTSITSWMSRATLETCEAGRGYLARFDAAIAGKTDAQFAAETTAWQTKFDAWNDAIGAARAAEPDITWDTLNARYGECPWPPPVTPTSQYRPTGPFGTMVERVAPYGVAGFLWYQGEEDEAHCESYRELLGLMIDEWRGLWNRSDDCAYGRGTDCTHRTDGCGYGAPLPFLIVQLPQWIDKNTAAAHADPLHWPVIREAQWDAACTIANVFTVTTIDCGEFDNIHPTNKRTPGERLADCALRNVYGRDDIAVDGPTPVDATVVNTVTGTVTLRLDHANRLHFDGTVPGTYGRDPGNNTANDEPAHRDAGDSGFELAGEDGVFHPADAVIACGDEHHGGTVTLRSPAVAHPTAVRYAWRSWGPAPLFNESGLPAPPFRRSLR
ncbi:sialate O-acetylesterase [Bifidobacterium biavatii]|uniref:Sialic acidspecific 9-O-acetylesterase n=1 Tax=Bifidobacterium biavatii DSM 23969 TaxID=1437608 RepID=A0A086ZNI1_9BIFI|nr:sialate O-acetylesterase [Bifidobacterium biavatii]KFI48081.1 sialic acidspecific 9-O-acetylesterase [Bifidobacterium biavatii DSM 23969]